MMDCGVICFLGAGIGRAGDDRAGSPRRCRVLASGAPNRRAFKKQLEDGRARLCFVGMSNCGKSFRSNQLRETLGFNMISVDEEIEEVILPELEALGYKGIEGMAQWMGFPYEDRFKKNEKKYLEIEENITASVDPEEGQSFVLDTTGSVIYMPRPVLQSLRDNFLVVHFLASDNMVSEMIENYFKMPKPVSWGDSYNQMDGEDGDKALRRLHNAQVSESLIKTSLPAVKPSNSIHAKYHVFLRRCYPELLAARRKQYEQLAHVSIPAETSLSYDVSCDELLEITTDLLSPCYKSGI
mmetsp:Transcript_16811/g.24181  ORF Transcript_16811/g.24181 Transcript_16811/m.24181 type:complete len:297 (-) Transcript_16811:962-1852(-)